MREKRKLKIELYGKLCDKHFLRKYGKPNKYGNSVDAEFPSRWEYPEKEMDQLVDSLEAKDKVYIKILTYEFENEYVSFRIFSQGKWEIKI